MGVSEGALRRVAGRADLTPASESLLRWADQQGSSQSCHASRLPAVAGDEREPTRRPSLAEGPPSPNRKYRGSLR
jgi:hypothetical protein